MRLPITLIACAGLLAQFALAAEPEKLPGSRVLPNAPKTEQPKPEPSASESSMPEPPKPERPKPVPQKRTPKAESKKTEPTQAAEAPKVEPPKERRELTDAEVQAMVKARLEAMRKARAARAAAEARAAESKVTAKQTDRWSYEGETGPLKWGKLNPAWAKCDSGNRQSPIDIRDGIKVDLEPVVFEYSTSAFNVVNNGNTVQVNVASGNRFTLTGRTYELQQFHFHRPSEEKIDGKSFEMVAHLVHKDEEGRLAVIAVLIENGTQHAGIQTVWNNLPLEKNEPLVPIVQFDPTLMLPQRREYYTYMGSLTTPPCSEGVLWIVMKEPIQASRQQLDIFARLYPMNARPVQAMSGRLIKESN